MRREVLQVQPLSNSPNTRRLLSCIDRSSQLTLYLLWKTYSHSIHQFSKWTTPHQTPNTSSHSDSRTTSLLQSSPLEPEKLDVLKSELQKLLDLGIIEPTESPLASLLHLVPKKNPVEFRVTGDFRLLNEQKIAHKYSIRLFTDFIGMLGGSTVFNTLDLYKSNHQIRIAPEDIHKTAMITLLGNYAFKRLAMGLKSASNILCRFMHEVLRGVPNCFVYIDDIMIFSKSEEDHWKHFSEVFNRLEYFSLILN